MIRLESGKIEGAVNVYPSPSGDFCFECYLGNNLEMRGFKTENFKIVGDKEILVIWEQFQRWGF